MDLLVTLVPVTLILSVGIFVQAAAGFAAGLLIVPSLLWVGYQIPEASTALLIATIPQNLMGVWTLRKSIPTDKIFYPGLGRVVALPAGVIALLAIEDAYSIVGIRQIVGGVVLLATLAIILFNPTPRERIHPIWAWLAFPISGFLQGMVGMGGPVMVFWVQAHDWSTRQIRGFLFGMYLISILPALAVFCWFFGNRVWQPIFLATCSLPALLLVTSLGLRFGDWLGRQRLRRVTLGLLILIGLSGLAAPWIQPESATDPATSPTSLPSPTSPPPDARPVDASHSPERTGVL